MDKKLKERDDFLENHAGGEDDQREYRDRMIRSLPDIKELSRKRDNTSVTIDQNEDPAAKEVLTPSGSNSLGTPSGSNGIPGAGATAPLLQPPAGDFSNPTVPPGIPMPDMIEGGGN